MSRNFLRYLLLPFLVSISSQVHAGLGARAGRDYGFFIGAGSPPVSVISVGGVYNVYSRLKFTLEVGGGFKQTTTGGSLDFLMNPNEPFSLTAGFGLYHMHIEDPDLFFDNGVDESRNLTVSGPRVGFDWMTSRGINICGGVGYVMQRLLPKSHESTVYPYLNIGYVF